MRRVCIFSTAYLPHIGGAEIAVKEITDRLADDHFVCITAKMDSALPRVEQIGNVEVHRVGWGIPMLDKMWLALFGWKVARKLHAVEKFDCAWAIMASYGGLAAERFVAKTDVPMLLTVQEGDTPEHIAKRARMTGGRFGKIFERATALQAISAYLQDWAQKMGFAGKHSVVIPNGVAVEQFAHVFSAEEKAHARAEFGFNDNARIAVTVSRLVGKNGVGDSIAALTHLPEEFCLVIAGEGELRHQLESQVAELGLQSRVRFLGLQPYDSLPLVLQACDVFVRPSISEGLGNVFLEAMAAGIPVVGTRVGGIVDFLEHGKTGFVCKPSNPQSVATALSLAVEENSSVIAQAKAMVVDRFTWDSVVQRMDKVFTTVCES